MPDTTEPWDITDDETLRQAVRGETGYDDSTLPQPDLESLVNSAKRVLALKAGIETFYDDRGVSVALYGLTCAKAKGRVENSPVRVEDIGPTDVTYRTTDGSSLQVAEYESMTQLGLSESDAFDDPTRELTLTNTYLHD